MILLTIYWHRTHRNYTDQSIEAASRILIPFALKPNPWLSGPLVRRSFYPRFVHDLGTSYPIYAPSMPADALIEIELAERTRLSGDANELQRLYKEIFPDASFLVCVKQTITAVPMTDELIAVADSMSWEQAIKGAIDAVNIS